MENPFFSSKNNCVSLNMLKKLLYIAFLCTAPVLFAQEINRVSVKGKIHVPQGEDAEGISVYNSSAQKGTITDENGAFTISVAENDRLQIFALQYQPFTAVIDKGIVERKKLNIYVHPSVTHLEEVIVRPYDLTGNIRADIEKIPTFYADKNWDLSYTAMEFGYGFVVDAQTSIKGNVAENTLNPNYLHNGTDIIAIMGGVANLLFPKSGKTKNRKVDLEDSDRLSNNLQQRFSRQFVEDNFDIPQEEAVNFLWFVQDRGFDKNLLKVENELQLMQFLENESKEYKKNFRDE